MIPTNLDALAASELLSEAGRARLAAEPELPPAPAGEDESVASFVSRRLGREAYEAFVEPLVTGIYGSDGEQLSLEATFPNLRALELEHGSVMRGLLAQPAQESGLPPFLTLRAGMDGLVTALARAFERTELVGSTAVSGVSRGSAGTPSSSATVERSTPTELWSPCPHSWRQSFSTASTQSWQSSTPRSRTRRRRS